MQLTQEPEEYKQDLDAGRKIGHRYYVAKFLEWTETQRRAQVKITESIGEAGNLEAESMRLLRTHDICTEAYENEDQEPTENVHECLRHFSQDIDPETKEWVIPESEIAKRLDLRNTRIFTIDPITAKDLDDALSVEHIEGSIYEIGVHIADVSYFVQQGTDLDREALKRCTSTYFVHRVYPMLPRLLCERLCSLNPKVDRLAYSIFFRMDMQDGSLVTSVPPRIARSVIRSCAKWNYELVQSVLDKEVTSESQLDQRYLPQGQTFDDMVKDCFLLN
jgi:VacB/RNase II family 3'-5' exoribonuclease